MTAPHGPNEPSRAARFRIAGRVQGVGFRYHVAEAARDAGLDGWVRNLPDGTVEVHAQGDVRAIDRLAATLAEGPPPARVAGVEREDVETDGGIAGFRIRR